MKNLSIQTKLLGTILLVAVVNGLFAVFFFPSQQARQTEQAFRGEVESLARTVALGIAIGMETGDLSGVQRSMDFAKSNPNVRFVYLESDGAKLAAFPEDFELTEDVQSADSLVIGGAPIESEALPGHVYIGESNATLRAAQRASRSTALVIALLLVGFGALAAVVLARMIVRPLKGALDQINDLSEGRLHRVEVPERADEVGQMLGALNRTIEGLRGALEADEVDWDEITEQRRREAELREAEAKRIAQEREEARRQQVKADEVLSVVRSASTGDLTRSVSVSGDDALDQVGQGLNRFFEDLRGSMRDLNRNADTLSSAASALSDVTDGIRGEAHRTLDRARDASGAAARVSDNVRSVAAATEEMAATIREISRSAAHAAEVARSGVEMARSTNTSMEQLGQSSTEIGTVVEVIASIAEKTNLLALNATIEAARAGEAGKGFAVVASEVKQLATQSARAAQEIADKVGAIQSDSTEAVSALDAITRIIVEIDEIQSTIASAVEEQTATTGEIGRSLEDTAAATQEITTTVQSVAESAERTNASVSSAAASVDEVEAMSSSLAGLVGRFKVDGDGNVSGRKREAELVA